MGLKKIVKRFLERKGYTIVLSQQTRADADICKEREFMDIYEKCKPYTMVSVEKSFALYKAVEYIVRNNIPGDIVECGVWKGGQAMLVAYTLLKEGDTKRRIYLYDTFKGMAEPTEMDIRVGTRENALTTWKKENRTDHNDWCYASLEEVREHVISTGYPKEQFFFIEGKVEETIPKTLPQQIALLRLDTDWYASTYHELVHAYPVLEKGGVLIIDDYGAWEGSREATDQYIQESNSSILLNKIGGSGRIAVKAF